MSIYEHQNPLFLAHLCESDCRFHADYIPAANIEDIHFEDEAPTPAIEVSTVACPTSFKSFKPDHTVANISYEAWFGDLESETYYLGGA